MRYNQLVTTEGPYIKPDRASPEQIAAWRQMTFEQKLELADQLRTTALRLREAMLRCQEPGLSDEPSGACVSTSCMALPDWIATFVEPLDRLGIDRQGASSNSYSTLSENVGSLVSPR